MEAQLNVGAKTETEQNLVLAQRKQQLQKVWVQRLEKEEKAHDEMRRVMRRAEENYNAKLRDGGEVYIPLYWTVCNVQHVGIYSNQPVPDVRPRNELHAPVMQDVARVIQRALGYCIDTKGFDTNMHRVGS